MAAPAVAASAVSQLLVLGGELAAGALSAR